MIDSKNIQLLDTTLRDGGLGLEDAYINGISTEKYNQQEIADIVRCLQSSKIDIIELGSIEISQDDKTRFCIFQNVASISKLVPARSDGDQLFVALFRGPDTPVDLIPEHSENTVDGLRVILRYSELEKSLQFCEALALKGYKIFVQPMLTMRYTDEELDLIINYSNRMNAYALYFVDSYGFMGPSDIKRLYQYFDQRLKPDVRIGFHAHNNMNLAFSNTLFLFDLISTNRKIIVDSCATGMGQGAGNLQTEIITSYLNATHLKQYGFDSVLDICDIVERKSKESLWGYSVTRFLPALHKTAYKYAIVLRNCYNYSYRQINDFLEWMPNDYRNRYTKQSLICLLKEFHEI